MSSAIPRQIVLGCIKEPTKHEPRSKPMSGPTSKHPPSWFQLYFLGYE